MAVSVLEAVVKKYPKVLFDGLSLTDTPYLLWGVLNMKGLAALTYAGWNGELNLKFRMAIDEKELQFTGAPSVDETKGFKGKFLEVDLANLDAAQSLILQMTAVESKIEDFPEEFFTNLKALGETGLRKCLRLFSRAMNKQKFDFIKSNFGVTDGDSEASFYNDNFNAITEIFFKRTLTPFVGTGEESAFLTADLATEVLAKLVQHKERKAVLSKLKDFKYDMSFHLVEGKDLDKTPSHIVLTKFNIFENAGLVDPDWQEFSSFLTNFYRIETEMVADILSIINKGFTVKNFNSVLRSAPAAQLEQCLTHPVLRSDLLRGYHTDDCINSNPNLDPARKSAILGDLYRHLLQQEYGLCEAKREVASVWFASLSDAEKGEIISLGYANASNTTKMVEVFGTETLSILLDMPDTDALLKNINSIVLRSATAAQVDQCLNHPVMRPALLDGYFTDEHINLNPNLDPARKSAILGDLYRHLLQQEYGLYKAKREVASVWFASLGDAEKVEIISLGYANTSNAAKMVEVLGPLELRLS